MLSRDQQLFVQTSLPHLRGEAGVPLLAHQASPARSSLAAVQLCACHPLIAASTDHTGPVDPFQLTGSLVQRANTMKFA